MTSGVCAASGTRGGSGGRGGSTAASAVFGHKVAARQTSSYLSRSSELNVFGMSSNSL